MKSIKGQKIIKMCSEDHATRLNDDLHMKGTHFSLFDYLGLERA
jgi:hypothetical protein